MAALTKIRMEARTQPDLVENAPHRLPVRRLDEVRAARHLDLAWKPGADQGICVLIEKRVGIHLQVILEQPPERFQDASFEIRVILLLEDRP